jgi:hypothetical protein
MHPQSSSRSWSGSRSGNFLKVGAGAEARAEKNSFGSATLPSRCCLYSLHCHFFANLLSCDRYLLTKRYHPRFQMSTNSGSGMRTVPTCKSDVLGWRGSSQRRRWRAWPSADQSPPAAPGSPQPGHPASCVAHYRYSSAPQRTQVVTRYSIPRFAILENW